MRFDGHILYKNIFIIYRLHARLASLGSAKHAQSPRVVALFPSIRLPIPTWAGLRCSGAEARGFSSLKFRADVCRPGPRLLTATRV